jgi:hypothetical protein
VSNWAGGGGGGGGGGGRELSELNKVRGEIKIGIAMRLGFGGGKRKGC